MDQSPSHSSTCFSMLTPPPPAFTLFPYTTLFRSGGYVALWTVLPAALFLCVWSATSPALVTDKTQRNKADRKSTRLNSSHQINSYAVFCLKKKTKDAESPVKHTAGHIVQFHILLD